MSIIFLPLLLQILLNDVSIVFSFLLVCLPATTVSEPRLNRRHSKIALLASCHRICKYLRCAPVLNEYLNRFRFTETHRMSEEPE